MAFVFHYSFCVYCTLCQHLSWWGDPNLYLRITEPFLVLFILGCQFSTELIGTEVLRSGAMNPLGLKHTSSQPYCSTNPVSPLIARTVISFFSCWFHAIRCPKMARDKLGFQFIRTMARFLGGNIVLLEIDTPNPSSPRSWQWKQKFYWEEYYCNRRATPDSFPWFLAHVRIGSHVSQKTTLCFNSRHSLLLLKCSPSVVEGAWGWGWHLETTRTAWNCFESLPAPIQSITVPIQPTNSRQY